MQSGFEWPKFYNESESKSDVNVNFPLQFFIHIRDTILHLHLYGKNKIFKFHNQGLYIIKNK